MGRCLQWNEEIKQQLLELDQASNEQRLTSDPVESCTLPTPSADKCKTRNCRNSREEGCRMQMCSKCCIRVQRKTAEYNRANPTKPRVVLKHSIDFRERSNARATRSVWIAIQMESIVEQHEKHSTKMKSKRTPDTKPKPKPKPKPDTKSKSKPDTISKTKPDTKPKPKPKPMLPLKTTRNISHTTLHNPSVQFHPLRELVTTWVFPANSTNIPSNPRSSSLESERMNCAEGM